MKKILIAGGTGFVGEHLRRSYLSEYAEVYILTTQKSLAHQSNYIYWQPSDSIIEIKQCNQFDIIINLSGANIGEKYWTQNRKKILISSRIDSSLFLTKLIKEGKLITAHFIQTSAIGYYGDRADILLNESWNKRLGRTSTATRSSLKTYKRAMIFSSSRIFPG